MDSVYWEIIQQVLIVAIGVVLPPVLVLIANEARKVSAALVSRIQGEIGVQNYEMLLAMAEDAVATAEQLGLTDKIENLGEAKKAFALQRVQEALTANGIAIDINAIDDAIEAAVHKTFHQ